MAASASLNVWVTVLRALMVVCGAPSLTRHHRYDGTTSGVANEL
jgi:hypothetical protein